jgi:hypothetical protein
MSREAFIRQLEDAADNIGDMPRHELAILLRRAALRLRNFDGVPRDPEGDYHALIDEMNGDDPGAA